MRKRFLYVTVVGLLSLSLWSPLPQGRAQDPSSEQLRQEWMREIFREYCPQLRRQPDVLGCGPDSDGERIQIITDRPSAVPTEIDGIPIITQAPPPHLPPPPGVIVLRPDGTREARPELQACPAGYKEYQKYRWRFCNSIAKPQVIPADMMTPPIAGIPYEEAKAIFQRQEFINLPEVQGVGLSAEGIVVRTDQPDLIPSTFEGLPVRTEQVRGVISGLILPYSYPFRK